MRQYYTLVERSTSGVWSPQFGDFDRKLVELERQDYIDSGEIKGKNLKIITSGDTQAEIDAAVDKLNTKVSP